MNDPRSKDEAAARSWQELRTQGKLRYVCQYALLFAASFAAAAVLVELLWPRAPVCSGATHARRPVRPEGEVKERGCDAEAQPGRPVVVQQVMPPQVPNELPAGPPVVGEEV